jgi:hypothetical protein
MPVNPCCCAPTFGPSVILFTLRDLVPTCVTSGLPSGGSILPDFSILNGLTFALHTPAVSNAYFYNLAPIQVYTAGCATLSGSRIDLVETYNTNYSFGAGLNSVGFAALLRYWDPAHPSLVGYWDSPLFSGSTGLWPTFPVSGSIANGGGPGTPGPFGGSVDFEGVFNRYTVTSTSGTFSNASQSGSVSFNLTQGRDLRWFAYRVSALYDPKTWVTITSATSGTGTTGTLTFTLDANGTLPIPWAGRRAGPSRIR